MTAIDKMYELEQHIMECWQLVDDVNLLCKEVMDNDLHNDQDKLANALLGLHTIYQIKFEHTFKTYEETLKQYFNETKNDSQSDHALSRKPSYFKHPDEDLMLDVHSDHAEKVQRIVDSYLSKNS